MSEEPLVLPNYYRVKAVKSGYNDSDWKTGSNGCLVTGPPVLSVSPSVITVSRNSGTGTFRVSNTGEGTLSWNAAVVSGNDWLTISDGSGGTDEGIITCQFEANKGTSSRSSIIRITADNATGSPKDVTLTQLAIIPFDMQEAFEAIKVISGQDTDIDVLNDFRKDGKMGLPEAAYLLQSLSDLRNPDTVMAPEVLSVPENSGTGNYTVSWSESSTSGAITYVLEEAKDHTFTSGLRVAYSGIDTVAQISGRAAEKTYYYRVKASTKGFLNSDWKIGSNGCDIAPQ